MQGIICYFSCSGNTKAACAAIRRKLAPVIDLALFDIASGEYPDFSAYAVAGFATFTDELQLPDLMVEYIRNIKPVAGLPAFVFNTFGSIPGKTALQFRSVLETQGFAVIGGLSLHTPENYPPMINMRLGFTQQPSDRQLKKFHAFISRLQKNVLLIADNNPPRIYPIKIGALNRILPIRKKFLSKKTMGIKRIAAETCTRCGLCAKICPYHAVAMEEYPVFDEAKCRACWACYNHCPTGSIHSKTFKGEGRYPKPLKPYLEKLDQL